MTLRRVLSTLGILTGMGMCFVAGVSWIHRAYLGPVEPWVFPTVLSVGGVIALLATAWLPPARETTPLAAAILTEQRLRLAKRLVHQVCGYALVEIAVPSSEFENWCAARNGDAQRAKGLWFEGVKVMKSKSDEGTTG